MRRFLQFVCIGLLFLVAILFGVNNRQDIIVNMAPLPWQAELPLFLYLMLALIAGVLLGGAAVLLSRQSVRKELRQTQRELRKHIAADKTESAS